MCKGEHIRDTLSTELIIQDYNYLGANKTRGYSNEQEGLGFSIKKRFIKDESKNSGWACDLDP